MQIGFFVRDKKAINTDLIVFLSVDQRMEIKRKVVMLMISSTDQAKFYKQIAEKMMQQQGIDPKKWREETISQGYQKFVLDNQQNVLRAFETQKPKESHSNPTNPNQNHFKSDQESK